MIDGLRIRLWTDVANLHLLIILLSNIKCLDVELNNTQLVKLVPKCCTSFWQHLMDLSVHQNDAISRIPSSGRGSSKPKPG